MIKFTFGEAVKNEENDESSSGTGRPVGRRLRFVLGSDTKNFHDDSDSSKSSSEHEDSDNSDHLPAEDLGELVGGSDRSPVEKIFSYRPGQTGREFFCKLRNRPYRSCTWIAEEELGKYAGGRQMMRHFLRKHPLPPQPPYYEPLWNEVDRVIAERVNEAGRTEYFVKWMDLDYDRCTWEVDVDEEDIELFRNRNKVRHIPKFVKPDKSKFVPMKTAPEFKSHMELFSYQLEGVNWLLDCWYNNKNCILADEMGLGKTVQAVAFLELLFLKGVDKPSLIVAPLQTLLHWDRVFKTWTDRNVVIYMGDKLSRETAYTYDFFYPHTSIPKFDAIVTSYEVAVKDIEILKQFEFSTLIVDEAHKLKNVNSRNHQALRQTVSHFRILLTGTPLQNTLEELQSLLEFLHPGKFQDVGTATLDEAGINRLRGILKGHLLRRLKVDVDKSIGAKEETIIECTMTKAQKQFYRAVLEQNAGFLSKGMELKNIAMELRKVCIHPYLVKGAEDKILAEKGIPLANLTLQDKLDAMIRSSGKMILLDKLLPKLKADGHRVLIFSQMTRLLDILEDYLVAVGYTFRRIDGNVKGPIRQSLIDQFNAEGSDIFVFLLCTKAGGLGINLNAADTVVIFDSDWNPQGDLQAQARCHRIGQRKTVKVYRLLSKGTYEEHMFETASRKLGLGYAILEKQKSKEHDMLIRQGAYHMLNEVEEENFGEEDIEQILSRSKTMVYNEAAGSAFSKANFDIDQQDGVDLDDPDFWQKMLPQQFAQEEEPEQEEGYMKTRLRKQQNPQILEDDSGEGTQDWKRVERDKLQTLLRRYGWGRWEDGPELVGLRRSVLQVKLAARAVLRMMLSSESDMSRFPTARLLLSEATSEEFDPEFVSTDEAEAADIEFRRQPSMLDPQWVTTVQKKGPDWLRRIELLWSIKMAVDKADNVLDDIAVPTVHGSPPADWWTIKDDKCLIFGTWKCGFARYESMLQDPEIPFTCKDMEDTPFPGGSSVTPRLKKLAQGIKRLYAGGDSKGQEIATEVYRPKTHLWRKRDRSAVLQRMLHEGVRLKEDGSFDWDEFREACQFTNKTNEQLEQFVEQLMADDGDKQKDDKQDDDPMDDPPTDGVAEKGNEKDDKDDKDDKNQHNITGRRVNRRHVALTELRKLFLSDSEAALKEFFAYLPRWRNVPRGWTPQMEYVFFKEISERGWCLCSEILKGEVFAEAFETEPPPTFMTQDTKVIRRIDQVMKYHKDHTIEELKEQDQGRKPRRKDVEPKQDDRIVPDIPCDEHGKPIMPYRLSKSQMILSLGKIVYDRVAFHSKKYIYPAGFKSSRTYTSTLDPLKKVKWTSEIIDTGDQTPLFRVTMDENPSVFYEGVTATNPWTQITKAVTKCERPKFTVSGPEFYGLANPAVVYMIQNLEGADKCVNYEFKKFIKQERPVIPKPLAVIRPLPYPPDAPARHAFIGYPALGPALGPAIVQVNRIPRQTLDAQQIQIVKIAHNPPDNHPNDWK